MESSTDVLTLAQELAKYSNSLRFGDLDEDVLVEVKKRVIDSIGCAIGAFREKPIREARRAIEENYPSKTSTILGTAKKTAPDMATFVNGAAIRYFDFNDTYLSKEPAHPSDNISACVALAESKGKSGKDLLLAIVLAYEIQCRLCDAASIRSRGWDHVCFGLVSSALAASRLYGLSVEEAANAVNISLNSHIAMRQVRAGELSDWKGFSFANASRNAVFSALLAGAGISGPSPIFEGEMGFFKQVSGEFNLDINSFGGREGTFKLPETYIKYYPAEYHAQSAVRAALEIRKEADPKEIKSVRIETHEAGYTILGKDREKWTPKTKETADHSLPYMVGSALLTGKLDNASYSPRRISDPETLSFLGKISVVEDPDLTREYPKKIANRITVELSDGQNITRQVDVPKGHPGNPMTREEIEHKFQILTKNLLGPRQIEAIFDFVWNLERQKELSQLFRLCLVKSR